MLNVKDKPLLNMFCSKQKLAAQCHPGFQTCVLLYDTLLCTMNVI